MRKLLYLFVLTIGFTHTAFGSGIDSTQWPFRDTVDFSFNLSGFVDYYQHYDSGPNGTPDNSHQYLEATFPEPGGYGIPSGARAVFTWRDASFDGTKWRFQTPTGWFELVIDTLDHVIRNLNYFRSTNSGFSLNESFNLELKDISYDTSGVFFADDNLSLHLVNVSYHSLSGHSWQYTTNTLLAIDTVVIFGQKLRNKLDVASELLFGTIPVGSFRNESLTLYNYNSTPICITNFNILEDENIFSLTAQGPDTIAAKDSGRITFQFSPRSIQYYSGSLLIYTNNLTVASYHVYLAGWASEMKRVEPSPPSLDRISVSPNPSSGKAILYLSAAKPYLDIIIHYYDGAAQLLQSQYVGDLPMGENRIPLSLPSVEGVWFARVCSAGLTIGTSALLVEH
jgi:hypothetical protein